MGYALKKAEQFWTYADYLQWLDDERWELIYRSHAPAREQETETVGTIKPLLGALLRPFFSG
jgi:hypothetical protein